MMEALVGAGGWGYFPGGLAGYARGFRFVELNASFYRPVPERHARRWRSSVPDDFVFSVKANRVITHSDRIRASARGRGTFAHDLRIAQVLRSPFVVLETPAEVRFGTEEVAGLQELAKMAPSGIRIGLEARAYRQGRLPEALRRVMEDERILDVVDLSQAQPRVGDEEAYTRLFGPGPSNVYQFDDNELRSIDGPSTDSVRAAFAFHGVRMYSDAARFLTFKRTGRFPQATSAKGLASLEEVLRPDARFPASRDELKRDHGWKIIDLDDRTRAHAVRLFETLPSRRFDTLEEMLSEIEIRSLPTAEATAGTPS
jgi:uncharacterized protein YecE (DUF72 family)